MIYLIRSFGRNGKSILKVGFTGDLETRKSQYYHSNPLYEFIGYRSGGLIEEKKIQLYLEILGYKYNKLQEWFYDNPEILSLFHSSIDRMDKLIWRNRNTIFSIQDLKKDSDKRLRDIYESLKNKYGIKYKQEIDIQYIFEKSKESYKKLKNDSDFLDLLI